MLFLASSCTVAIISNDNSDEPVNDDPANGGSSNQGGNNRGNCGNDEYVYARGDETNDVVCKPCRNGYHMDLEEHMESECDKDTTTATITTATSSTKMLFVVLF